MTEQKCYCIYLNELVDSGLCYDMQMICNGFIKPEALPNVEIDKEKLLACCNKCNHKE